VVALAVWWHPSGVPFSDAGRLGATGGAKNIDGGRRQDLRRVRGVHVEALGLYGGALSSLDGIERFEALRSLGIDDVKDLTDLRPIERATGLRYLSISTKRRQLAEAVAELDLSLETWIGSNSSESTPTATVEARQAGDLQAPRAA
jgi:hypothetical protein